MQIELINEILNQIVDLVGQLIKLINTPEE